MSRLSELAARLENLNSSVEALSSLRIKIYRREIPFGESVRSYKKKS
jgi:hypothetical protein